MWRPFKKLFSDAWYWFRANTYNRYHILNLQQPKLRNGQKNYDRYKCGWCDTDHRILYAVFNLLVEFVEKEEPHCPTEEEIEKESNEWGSKNILIVQRLDMLEIFALYTYWTKERNEMAKKMDEALTRCSYKFKKSVSLTLDEIENDEYAVLEKAFNAKEDEMLMRVMRIRRCLWT